jgi:hypothetical protein
MTTVSQLNNLGSRLASLSILNVILWLKIIPILQKLGVEEKVARICLQFKQGVYRILFE